MDRGQQGNNPAGATLNSGLGLGPTPFTSTDHHHIDNDNKGWPEASTTAEGGNYVIATPILLPPPLDYAPSTMAWSEVATTISNSDIDGRVEKMGELDGSLAITATITTIHNKN